MTPFQINLANTPTRDDPPDTWKATYKREGMIKDCDMIQCNHTKCVLAEQCAASLTCNSFIHHECVEDHQGTPDLRDVKGPEGEIYCSRTCKRWWVDEGPTEDPETLWKRVPKDTKYNAFLEHQRMFGKSPDLKAAYGMFRAVLGYHFLAGGILANFMTTFKDAPLEQRALDILPHLSGEHKEHLQFFLNEHRKAAAPPNNEDDQGGASSN